MVAGSNPALRGVGRWFERRHSFADRLITSEGWSGRFDQEEDHVGISQKARAARFAR
jgi:hypothetical protein